MGLALLSRPFGITRQVRAGSSVHLVLRRSYMRASDPKIGIRSSSTQVTVADAIESKPIQPIVAPKRHPIPGFPLSSLDNTSLLRSLLIAVVSSKKFLLLPALHTLSFLSKPTGGFLLDVDRNPLLHGILKKTFYDQFCAGETAEQTKACVNHLKSLGFRGVILTYAKETVFDHESQSAHEHGKKNELDAFSNAKGVRLDPDIDAWRLGTLETADQIGEGDILAVKLTGAGTAVTSAFAADETLPPQMIEALDEIAASCKRRRIRLIVDAESQKYQKAIDRVTVDLMRKFNRDGYAAIYNTYQAYLKATGANITNHLAEASKDGFTLGLKLVRGAYILSDNRALIHDTKQDTDDAYNSISQGALKQHIGEFGGTRPFPSLELFLASHNRESLLAALRLHQERVREHKPTVNVSFGQLHGMSDEVSFSLLQETKQGAVGPGVFKCSTWGSMSECLAYLVRRAVENRDAVLRTTEEYAALKRETWRRIKSIFGGVAA
ncbi:unnamed protein product [Clonostachys rhizophaga]|uniref:Proline dehydrogenase n=1 Tax=Clonostachys rhizophaga TaxID=160324 RepID=A0A9N9VHY2_9HYPO|nr:unnamed protein product [Clonostachys rhizophaga]